MALENKLNITDSSELARKEEEISKRKALELFETGLLDTFEVGTFKGLSIMLFCAARFSLKVAYQLGGLLAVISAPDKVGQYLNRVGVIPEFEP